MTGSFWRLSFAVPATAVPAFEAALDGLADAVTFLDDDEAGGRRAGPQPVSWAGDIWLADTCLIEALFADAPDGAEIARRLALAAAGANVPAPAFELSRTEARDWIAETQAPREPLVVGRIHVAVGEQRPPMPANAVAIHLAGTMAFGTGEHATTRGCLMALADIARLRRPRRVLDVGCGTGILAIAAAKATRRRVRASDIDARAVATTRLNARASGVGGLVDAVTADGFGHRALARGGHDLILANILARPLVRLMPGIARRLAPGGRAVLSGLLEWQEPLVISAARSAGLSLERRRRSGDWSVLVVRRGVRRATTDN